MEQALQKGFSLSWLQRLRIRFPARPRNWPWTHAGREHAGAAGRVAQPDAAHPGGTAPLRDAAVRRLYLPGQEGSLGYNLTKLYQEAVSRQWSSATDIPWETLRPLPDDIEKRRSASWRLFRAGGVRRRRCAGAVCGPDVARLSRSADVLLTQVMDESRHMEVFRKRALANGGGLMRMIDSVSDVTGGSTDNAREFTEMSSRLHIVGEGNVLTLFRLGELMAYNEAEKAIYRRAAQDEARHVAFGVLHARYMHECTPERREEIHAYLDEAEDRQATATAAKTRPPAAPT